MNKKTIAISVLTVVIVASLFAVTIFYYEGQISGLNSQIANLNSQIENLDAPYLVTALGINELNNATFRVKGVDVTSNALTIDGTITNVGRREAYNVGLQVIANDVFGTPVINNTILLNEYANYIRSLYVNGEKIGEFSPLNISPAQTAEVNVAILCQGAPVNWTLTPTYTRVP